MEFFVSPNFLTYLLMANCIIWIVAVYFILKTDNSALTKLLQFLISIFIPFIGSLFVLLQNLSTKAGPAKNKKEIEKNA